MTHLTPDAKSKLATTIRKLRGTKDDPNGGVLLRGLREQAQSVYRLDIADIEAADLAEEPYRKRRRLESWLMEQARADLAGQKVKQKAGQSEKEARQQAIAQAKDRHFTAAIKLAGATLLNRLVAIMQMEAQGMIKPAVVTGGQESPGYREFRDEFGPALCKGNRDGYGFLLGLVYDELAVDLPGVFGRANAMTGLTELFPVPVSTLRAVVTALNDPALMSAWGDDTTLGWVYQYWNDPEREALDDKLNGGGKLAAHEIASKTQMFTERYMVEWLLQNSLGQQWLAICKGNGWVPEVVADGTLERLEARRQDWRAKRELGEVALDALMPIEDAGEARWKYWVQQPELGGDGAEGAGVPGSIRELKILDPACGSGHFLVIAFDLLLAFYTEEARHRGESWSEQQIVESILENNLFGLDLDARAVQIAAAALYLKGKAVCVGARPKALNLVASNLNLAALPVDDPAREDLRRAVQAQTGIPGALTDEIVEALKGADAWGSLLQVDGAVDRAIREYEKGGQRSLLENEKTPSNAPLPKGEGPRVRAALLGKLEDFLTRYTHSDDLGLRLKGEQLAAGVRFIRMVREGAYDLVIGNPPYQGTSKMEDSNYVTKHYKNAKADLYAIFLERGLQLAKPGGLSAFLTMRNWMFISQYSKIREHFIKDKCIRIVGDLHYGAFTEIKDVSVSMSIFERENSKDKKAVFVRPVQYDLVVRDNKQIDRNVSGLVVPYKIFECQTNHFDVIKEKPLIYWWDEAFLKRYAEVPKLEKISPGRAAQSTGDNNRFTRAPWEEKKHVDLKIVPSASGQQLS